MAEIFHRTQLAADLAGKIILTVPGSASSSGLFLAAPRRTGKSTFLREDLRPQLEAKGALVVYVDLWADRRADPGRVIVSAIRAELAKHEGIVARLARRSGMEKVTVAGTSFSLERVGLGGDVSLSDALAALSDETGKMIVLVIDEAQHAITSDGGAEAMFALKAARDELNSNRHKGLRVVATGSNQDKLAMLRSSRDQAFFGAPLVKFPPLGRDYVQWFCENAHLASPLDPEAVYDLFVRASYRPEALGAAADALRFDFELQANTVAARFGQEVDAQIEASNLETLRVVHSLTPLQSAVLRVLAAQGPRYAPFEAQTINAYKQVMGVLAPGSSVDPEVSNVQQALAALQEKSIVWKEARGVYALEESALADLLAQEGMLGPVPGWSQKEVAEPMDQNAEAAERPRGS